MREYKFRGQRKDNKEWVYGDYFKTPLTDEATGSKPEDGWYFLCGKERYCISKNNCVYEVIPETVGQYIGLPDKNDNEIYDDDIVESKIHSPSKMLIEFIEGGYCATHPKIEGYPIDINHFYDSTGCMIEVVGNKHDNPELLK